MIAKTRKSRIALLTALSLSLSACGHGHDETWGSIVGAVIGVAIGSEIDSGHYNNGPMIGLMLGSAVGAEIGRDKDEEEHRRAHKAHERAMEEEREVDWYNPDSGNSGGTTPEEQPVTDDQGRICHDFTQQVQVDDKIEIMKGKSCKLADGSWETIWEDN